MMKFTYKYSIDLCEDNCNEEKIVFNFSKVLISCALISPISMSLGNTVHAQEIKSNSQSTNVSQQKAIAEGKSLTKEEIQKVNEYLIVKDNQYVLKSNNTLTNSEKTKVQDLLTVFNEIVQKNQVQIIQNDSNTEDTTPSTFSPFISFAVKKHTKHEKNIS